MMRWTARLRRTSQEAEGGREEEEELTGQVRVGLVLELREAVRGRAQERSRRLAVVGVGVGGEAAALMLRVARVPPLTMAMGTPRRSSAGMR